MADKGESTRYDRSGRVHVKSFAEITSCHTINISACSRGDNEKGVATVPNSTDTINSKGTKRQRNEENGVSSCKKSEALGSTICYMYCLLYMLIHAYMQVTMLNTFKILFLMCVKISK